MQLSKDLVGVTKEQMADVVIAYEPVWAIGTGLVCGAEEASKLKPYLHSDQFLGYRFDQSCINCL